MLDVDLPAFDFQRRRSRRRFVSATRWRRRDEFFTEQGGCTRIIKNAEHQFAGHLVALYEIGSAMSLFQIRNYAHEFRQAVEGKTISSPIAPDETAAPVDLEETRGARGSELTIDTPNASKSLSFRNESIEDSTNLPAP